jgi:hypothetical protein
LKTEERKRTHIIRKNWKSGFVSERQEDGEWCHTSGYESREAAMGCHGDCPDFRDSLFSHRGEQMK